MVLRRYCWHFFSPGPLFSVCFFCSRQQTRNMPFIRNGTMSLFFVSRAHIEHTFFTPFLPFIPSASTYIATKNGMAKPSISPRLTNFCSCRATRWRCFHVLDFSLPLSFSLFISLTLAPFIPPNKTLYDGSCSH